MEMVLNGVSTRTVRRITERLRGTSFSKSTVSELHKNLDTLVRGWNARPLEEEYPFVLVDAMVLEARGSGRVRSRSAHIDVGINGEGYREVLDLGPGHSESEASWPDFFRGLRNRGLQGVDLVLFDDHSWLVKATRRYFEGAAWQRCQPHLKRSIPDKVPRAQREEVSNQVKAIFDEPDTTIARHLLEGRLERCAGQLARAMQRLIFPRQIAACVSISGICPGVQIGRRIRIAS